MKIERRTFLKRSALGVGGILVDARLGMAQDTAPKSFDPFLN